MQPGRARTSGRRVRLLPLARWVGWVAPVCLTYGVLVLSCPSAALRLCSVLGHLAPVHQCARVVCCFACAVSWATWLLFTGVPARWVVSCVRCPGPLGSCSPVRPLGVLLCVGGVLGHLAPVPRCARSVCCVVRAVSWATWLLFTSVLARWVVLRVRCPGPLGSCLPVRPLGAVLSCGVLGHLAPVHRCSCSVCWLACAVSRATWLLFTGVPARCVVSRLRCPGCQVKVGGDTSLRHRPLAESEKVLNWGEGLNHVYGSRGPQRNFLPHSHNGRTLLGSPTAWSRAKCKIESFLNIPGTSAKHPSEKKKRTRLKACIQAVKIRFHSHRTVSATCAHTSSASISTRRKTKKASNWAHCIVSNVQTGQALLHSLLPIPAKFPPCPSAQPSQVPCLQGLFISQAAKKIPLYEIHTLAGSKQFL